MKHERLYAKHAISNSLQKGITAKIVLFESAIGSATHGYVENHRVPKMWTMNYGFECIFAFRIIWKFIDFNSLIILLFHEQNLCTQSTLYYCGPGNTKPIISAQRIWTQTEYQNDLPAHFAQMIQNEWNERKHTNKYREEQTICLLISHWTCLSWPHKHKHSIISMHMEKGVTYRETWIVRLLFCLPLYA